MAAARIAAILLAASVSVLSAQQETTTRLTVRATDVTGAPIPLAQVEITPSSGGNASALTTNAEGAAEFAAKRGSYQITIASPGFCPRNLTVAVAGRPEQVIVAMLEVSSCPGPCAGPCVVVQSADSPVLATAGEPSHGTLTVKVVDQTGAIIPGAQIEIRTEPNEVVLRAFTDNLGAAVLNLRAGSYTVTISARGFAVYQRRNVEVQDGSDQHLRVGMFIGHEIPGPVVQSIEPPVYLRILELPIIPVHRLKLMKLSAKRVR